jgi:signal transduction histidine kinase
MMPDGGKLYFSATSDDSRLELIIKDENTRLQSNELQKILDNYYYTDKNDNTINGLAVPKFLIETMNGTLKIEIKESGTSYRITFPRVFS